MQREWRMHYLLKKEEICFVRNVALIIQPKLVIATSAAPRYHKETSLRQRSYRTLAESPMQPA
jgi:hypothetical protein